MPRHSMYDIFTYIYLHWGGFRGQCRHIFQSHGVLLVLENLMFHFYEPGAKEPT